jgi:hypothetical protein
MHRKLTLVAAMACVVLFPAAASSQDVNASIAGVVKDTSGAVLPGVTVEASSPVLIERVRTTVSDGSGQFRIINLQPGTYSVTFTLTGFSSVKREGVEVSGSGVVAVSADLRIGAVEETITVRGETPVVDVQSSKRQTTLSSEILTSIPSARGYAGVMLVSIPSMIQSGGGTPNIQLSAGMVVFGGRGGRGNEGRVQVDGLNTGASLNGGGVSGYRQDTENAQEIAITTAGGLGEAEVGGPAMNVVPKTGGNTFKFHGFASGLPGAWQASNYTQALIDAGLRRPSHTNYLWTWSGSVGGPIRKDRLWFFTTTSLSGSGSDISGMYHNKNAGDPTRWTYEADLTRPAVNDATGKLQPNLRLTLQASPRNRFNLFWDEQNSNDAVLNGSPTASPETDGWNHGYQRVQQATWTSPVSNRVLFEAGVGTYLSNYVTRERPGNLTRDLVRVTEQCTAGCAANGNIPGLVYRSQDWGQNWIGAHTWRASASYVTGAHNMKFGYQGAFHVDDKSGMTNNLNLAYRFNNGVPNQISQNLQPIRNASRVRYNAFYAQDGWTHERLTLQGAVRYDHSWSYYPAQQIGSTRFLPTPLVFDQTQGVIGYNDITPRLGATYDLFGTGRTAVKFTTGRYLEAAVNGNGNYSALLPSSRVATSVTRTWNDANRNYVPDCDLASPLSNAECGQISDLNFGKNVYSLSYDQQILKGWGVRPADWGTYVTVQQQLSPRMSMEVGYSRRVLQNFTVTDNLAVSAADYQLFSIVAPLDPRLPGGGGYTVSGLYDVNPNKFGQTNNLRTYAPNYGSVSSVYNGLELSITARMRNGLQLQAGSSTGQTVVDYCEVRAQLPEQVSTGVPSAGGIPSSPTNPYCHIAPGINTRATALASYTIPKIDVQLSGTFQSSPGIPLDANWTVSNAVAAQSLGRNLGAGANSNVTVNLLAPDQMQSPRVNQLDFRVGKILRFGAQRAQISLELYNVMNVDTVLGYNFAFIPGGQWMVPTTVLTARTAKLTVQYDF